jgi:hypothetical protein
VKPACGGRADEARERMNGARCMASVQRRDTNYGRYDTPTAICLAG